MSALGPLSFWATQAFGISLYLFFAGKFLAQLAPLGVVVLSFVADVTTRAERSLAFSLVIGAFGLVFQAINLAALVGSSGIVSMTSINSLVNCLHHNTQEIQFGA